MTILDRIVASKRTEIERLPREPVSPQSLRSAIEARGGLRPFERSLREPRTGDIGLIAEIKKASPSKGVIRPDFDPVAIARLYEAAGAGCLSVLTDQPFFQGRLQDLREVREAVTLPLLRKDFILDERQLTEAVEAGADAILLIVAILDDDRLRALHTLATSCGLAALVEVHDEPELDRALAAGARLLGVNNRNLRTFDVDLGTTERLAGILETQFPPDQRPLLVAESGIASRADVERVARAGARAVLVGESLMRQDDIPSKVRELIGAR